jgi:hypothetical protein
VIVHRSAKAQIWFALRPANQHADFSGGVLHLAGMDEQALGISM